MECGLRGPVFLLAERARIAPWSPLPSWPMGPSESNSQWGGGAQMTHRPVPLQPKSRKQGFSARSEERTEGHRRAVAGGQSGPHGVALINGSLINGPTSWHFACRAQFSSGEVTGGAGVAGSAPLKGRFLFFFLFFWGCRSRACGSSMPHEEGGSSGRTFPKTHTRTEKTAENRKFQERSFNSV